MDQAAAFIRSHPTRHFAKGDILLYQGEEPAALIAIRKGYVKVHDMAADGSEQLIWIAKKYDVIPLEWLFNDQRQSPFFYTAFTDCDAYVMPKAAFLDHVRQNNDALLQIITAITAKYMDILKHANAVQKPLVRDRLVSMLVFFADRFGDVAAEKQGTALTLPLTHQDIASLVGVTREKTSLELKRLKDEGYISYDKQSFVVYPDKLHALTV
jgi:CRP/FNR family transcriptional regulator, cyclic AMP receptor protein